MFKQPFNINVQEKEICQICFFSNFHTKAFKPKQYLKFASFAKYRTRYILPLQN